MEIDALLNSLEDILEMGKTVPFTDKCIVEKNKMLKMIQDIRLNLPDELKQAKWIREERERIIAEAQKDAADIVKEAENRIIAMIDEHEITKKAYEKKNEILEDANRQKDEIITKANERYRNQSKELNNYADNVLEKIEDNMADLIKTVNQMEKNLSSSLDVIKNNRRELK